jgi:hypothetical protein
VVFRFWRRAVSALETEGNMLQCLWNEYTSFTFDKTCYCTSIYLLENNMKLAGYLTCFKINIDYFLNSYG